MTSQIRKVAGGVIQSLKSGEGFVFDFMGPGWVMTQTRNPSALEAWVRRLMPGETGGATGGVLGASRPLTSAPAGRGRRPRRVPPALWRLSRLAPR